MQVAAPKKRPKEKSEPVETDSSYEGRVKERLETLLQDAAKARTSSITLSNLDYAKELSEQLLTHATGLENLYKTITDAMNRNADEAEYKKILKEVRVRDAFGEKAQVGSLNTVVHPFSNNGICNLFHDIHPSPFLNTLSFPWQAAARAFKASAKAKAKAKGKRKASKTEAAAPKSGSWRAVGFDSVFRVHKW